MIETRKLTRHFGTTVAVHELDLRVEPGEILGFLGPNGAGKSTTVKMLTGLLQPTAGEAFVAGHDVVREPLEAKRRFGFVPESGAMYETLTGREYLAMVADLHLMEPERAGKRIADLLDLFGLLDAEHRRLKGYSKGMRQKVLIIAALLHNPDVLCFDEPLNGIDANSAMVVKDLLRELAAKGKTILFCSHVLEVVERICTRIVIIDQGRRIAEGTAAEIASRSGVSTLEEAFADLTGGRDTGEVTRDFLAALE